VDMETGQRGFLLTGKDEALEPYESGCQSLESNLDLLTNDDIAEVQRRVDRWHQRYRHTVCRSLWHIGRILRRTRVCWPINAASLLLKDIAEGDADLTARLPVKFQD